MAVKDFFGFTDGTDTYNVNDKSKAPITLLKDTVGWVGKNKLEVTATSHTDEGSGTVYTVNTDKSISCANTPSANTSCFVGELDASALVVGKKYILSGCPASGSDEKWYLRIGKKANASDTWGTMVVKDFGEGAEFTVPSNDYGFVVHIGIMANQSTGFMFYPMLRDASITDSTFEPYHKSVEDWGYTREEADVLGAKNLAPWTLANLKASNTSGTWTNNVYVQNGVTFTVNLDSDGNISSISTSGTANARINFSVSSAIIKPAFRKYIGKKLRLTGCASGGVVGTSYWLSFFSAIGDGNGASDTGSGIEFTLVDFSNFTYEPSHYLAIANGTNVTDKVFKPMVTLASDTDSTYVPYAMTNRELTDAVTAEYLDFTTDYTSELDSTNYYCKVVKQGKIVVLSFAFNGLTVSGYSPILTVPSKCKPPKNVVGFCMNSNAYMLQLYVDTSGKLNTRDAINNGTIRGCMTYAVE